MFSNELSDVSSRTMSEDGHVSETEDVDEHYPSEQCPIIHTAMIRAHMSTHSVLENVNISNGKETLIRKRKLIGEDGFMSCP